MACKYLTHGPRAAARRATSCAGDEPVAGRANIATSVSRTPGKNRKLSRALEIRRADYTTMMATRNATAGGAQQRKDTGGYHRPGSNQR